MENNGLSSNENKVLAKIGECIKVDVPSLAEKTGLSRPTARNIVKKLVSEGFVLPHAVYMPQKVGLNIMTVYEVTYPAFYQGAELEKHIRGVLDQSKNTVFVMRINPSQAVIIAFYKNLEQKDAAFASTMGFIKQKYGETFQVGIKELWTRPSKDFFYDTNLSKLLTADRSKD